MNVVKLAIVGQRVTDDDDVSSAIAAQVDMTLELDERPDVVVFANQIDRRLPCRAHVVGSSWELRCHPDFADSHAALFHWRDRSELLNAIVLLHGHGPEPICYFHGHSGDGSIQHGWLEPGNPSAVQVQLLAEHAPRVWTMNSFDASILRLIGVSADRIAVVPYPIEPDRALISRRRTGRVDIAVVDGLAPASRTDLLLDALVRLPTHLRQSVSVHVSATPEQLDGPCAAEVMAAVREQQMDRQLELVRHERDEDRWALLERCHVLVDVSERGAWVRVIEAYRAGCRVISATCGYAPWIVEPPDALVDPGDPLALSAALGAVVEDVLEVRMVDRRAQLRTGRRYGREATSRAWRAVLTSLSPGAAQQGSTSGAR